MKEAVQEVFNEEIINIYDLKMIEIEDAKIKENLRRLDSLILTLKDLKKEF